MNALSIRVTWPDGTYHGREWPPSPLRLYQALLAGGRSGREPDAALDAALRHLERLPPPVIVAPPAVEQSPVAAAVPNNDGDVILAHWAAGADQKARASEAKLRTIRVRRAWRFNGSVTYVWRAAAETRSHREGLRRLCGALTCLGQGTDLAWARLEPDALDPRGVAYRPDPVGGRAMTVPYPGAFDVLEARYQALRSRIEGGAVRGVPEPDHAVVGYRSDLDPPARRWVLLSLREPQGDRAWSAEGTRLLDVAAMTRHAIGEAAQRAGLDAETIAAVMGHRDEARILIHPLPNVGHLYADGRIRRVLLAAPPSLDARAWQAVVYRLTGAPLTPLGSTEPVALLLPAARDDKLIDRFIGQGTQWTTATPVVLPGQDHRRGKPRPQRSLRRLLRHAGIPEALVESVEFEAAPRLRGSPRARDCRLPSHLRGLPTAHLSIRWKLPVAGPLALGAGVGYGFGVLSLA